MQWDSATGTGRRRGSGTWITSGCLTTTGPGSACMTSWESTSTSVRKGMCRNPVNCTRPCIGFMTGWPTRFSGISERVRNRKTMQIDASCGCGLRNWNSSLRDQGAKFRRLRPGCSFAPPPGSSEVQIRDFKGGIIGLDLGEVKGDHTMKLTEIEVKGRTFEVHVDDRGQFLTKLDSDNVLADTLADLKSKLAQRISRSSVKLDIPFVRWEPAKHGRDGFLRKGSCPRKWSIRLSGSGMHLRVGHGQT